MIYLFMAIPVYLIAVYIYVYFTTDTSPEAMERFILWKEETGYTDLQVMGIEPLDSGRKYVRWDIEKENEG